MAKLEKLRTLIPMEKLEHGAQQQIYAALELDFLKVLAIMPDCHKGYSLPIGGVALLEGVISPYYVGYDIGCGMCYVVTDMDVIELANWDKKVKLFEKIMGKIPIGVGIGRKEPIALEEFKSASGNKDLNKEVAAKLEYQVGSLGSGNHFIEIGKNKHDKITVTIHSGSRGPGHAIAQYHMNIAKLNDQDLPKEFLHFEGDLGQQYREDALFAEEYACLNREILMSEVLDIMGFSPSEIRNMFETMVNENHNHHANTSEGILHRKGATPAEKDQIGIIPGTMKSGTYVTVGLGNEEFLCSSSHGAGRKFSRTHAKKSIDLDQHEKWMKGIVAPVCKATLDESHGAYKDVESVIEYQSGRVIEVIDHSVPLIVAKGFKDKRKWKK